MNIKDLIKKELEEQKKGSSIKSPQKPPAGYDEDGREFDYDEDKPESAREPAGRAGRKPKDYDKGGKAGDAWKMKREEMVRETIRQEIISTLEEHGEIDEGFLDRLKARAQGAMGSAGAKVSQARSKVAQKVAGKDSDVTYTGADPQAKKKALMLKSRTSSALKKYNKFIQDFQKDSIDLGLGDQFVKNIVDVSQDFTNTLSQVISAADSMASGKAAAPAATQPAAAASQPAPFEIKPRTTAQRQARAAKVANRQTQAQGSAEPFEIKPRTTAQRQARAAKVANRQTQAQGSAPLDTTSPQSPRDKIRKAVKKKVGARGAARRAAAKIRQRKGLEEHIIQKIVDMLVERLK